MDLTTGRRTLVHRFSIFFGGRAFTTVTLRFNADGTCAGARVEQSYGFL